MKILKVLLWGNEIGRLVWDDRNRTTFFMFNSDLNDAIPDVSPLLLPLSKRNLQIPVYGNNSPKYQGLPPFISDSLPDSWGNTLFDKWVKENKIPRNKITPLYKLMFIGVRGMGALEYEPSVEDFNQNKMIDIKSLYDLSLKILEERDDKAFTMNEELTLQALLSIGTSAGGRQMKAIIAINKETGEIRSGQIAGLKDFDYYILKFGDNSFPMAEIEAAYYKMATEAGVNMEYSRLFPIQGTNHFLTQRFDRKDGNKIHIQTLAALNPEALSYEDLIATCRELDITESEIEQIFTRMVFNVIANNTDDHNKNFSFMLEKGGKWKLAPAYDITFIFNHNATGPNINRRFSINGKIADITKEDLIEFADQNGIRNSKAIIKKIGEAIAKFDEYAEEADISQPYRGIIRNTLNQTLIDFGLKKRQYTSNHIFDLNGKEISDFSISLNSKAHYVISIIIDGKASRRFIRQNNPLYNELKTKDIYNLPKSYQQSLIEQLFN